MSTTDIQQTWITAEEAFHSGEFDKARRYFQRVKREASPRSEWYDKVAPYMRHLGESNEDDGFQLLNELRRSSGSAIDLQLELVEKALDRGLERDLNWRRLEDLRSELKTIRTAQADEAAQELLDRLEQEQDIERAVSMCEDVLSRDNHISEEMRTAVKERKTELERQQQALDLISDVEEQIDQSEMTPKAYEQAYQRAQKAKELAPQDPCVERVLSEAQECRQRVEDLQNLIADAKEKTVDDPAQAMAFFESAAEEARDLRLDALADESETGHREAKKALEEQVDQAQKAFEQGEKAEAAGDVEEARTYYEEAIALSAMSTPAQQRLDQLNQALERRAEVERLEELADEARQKFDYSRAIQHLEEALRLATDPDRLEALEEKLETYREDQADALEITTTIKLQDLPFATPAELDRVREDLEDKVGPAGLNAMLKLFRGQATRKLRVYLQTGWRKIDAGQLEAAGEVFDTADELWTSYLEEESAFAGTIPALRNRLDILAAQRADLRDVQDEYGHVVMTLEEAEEALRDDAYKDALESYEEIMEGFRFWPDSVRYLLGDRRDRPNDGQVVGVLGRACQGFAQAARRYGSGQAAVLADWHREAEAAFRLVRPESLEEARRIVEERARPLAERLRKLYEEYAALPQEQTGEWAIKDWTVPFETLGEKITDAINLQAYVSDGEALLNAGDYARAEDKFQQALQIDPGSIPAQQGLERADRLRELRQQLRKAEAEKDAKAQDECLQAALNLLPLSTWVETYRQEQNLDQKLRDYARHERNLKRARALIQQGQFDVARPLVEEVLRQEPENPQAIQLQTEVEEGEAGRQRFLQLRKDAHAAFNSGNFSRAELLAEQVLERRPEDKEIDLLRQRADRVRRLENDAGKAMAREDYEQAGRLLQEVRNTESVRSVSDRHNSWMLEIEEKLTEARDFEDLVFELRQANKQENWINALSLAFRVLSQERNHIEARRIQRSAHRKLVEQVESALEQREAEALDETLPALQELERRFPKDETVLLLRQQFDRISDLVTCQLTLQRKFLNDEKLESVVRDLSDLCSRWDDQEAREAYDRAHYRQLTRQAERFELAGDRPRAIESLKHALEIRQEPEVVKKLRDLRLDVALDKSTQSLMAGDFTEAREVLLEFRNERRVVKQLELIDQLSAKMREVRRWQREGDDRVPDVVRELDDLLSEHGEFQPARKMRRDVIDNLLSRAQAARDAGDLWEARRLYEIVEEASPRDGRQSGLSEVRRDLENNLKYHLLPKAAKALNDPDLKLAECETLLEDLRAIPALEHKKRRNLREYVRGLEDRRQELILLKDHMIRAENWLEEAHRDKNKYQMVENELQQISRINPLFNQRRTVRDLGETFDTHKKKRQRVQDLTETYREDWEKLRQLEATPKGGLLNQAQGLWEQTKHRIEQLIRTNSQIKELDPDNLYGLRRWLDKNNPDPLEEELEQFQAYKAALDATGHPLVDGLTRWQDAQEYAKQARSAQEKLEADEDYERAIRLWDETEGICHAAVERFESALGQDAPIPAVQVLQKRAQDALEAARSLEDESQGHAEHLEHELEMIQETYKEAIHAENRAQSCQQWRAAESAYGGVLEINSEYQPARKGRQRCMREIEETCSRRPWWVYALAAPAVLVVSALAWFAVGGNLGPAPQPSPTPSPNPGIVIPTMTPTPVESATPTPEIDPTVTMTPSPSPTLRPTVPPQICLIYNGGSAWVRSEPDVTSTGIRLLPRNTELNVVDFIDLADGKWYEIEEPIEGWVRAVEVTCPESE